MQVKTNEESLAVNDNYRTFGWSENSFSPPFQTPGTHCIVFIDE